MSVASVVVIIGIVAIVVLTYYVLLSANKCRARRDSIERFKNDQQNNLPRQTVEIVFNNISFTSNNSISVDSVKELITKTFNYTNENIIIESTTNTLSITLSIPPNNPYDTFFTLLSDQSNMTSLIELLLTKLPVTWSSNNLHVVWNVYYGSQSAHLSSRRVAQKLH